MEREPSHSRKMGTARSALVAGVAACAIFASALVPAAAAPAGIDPTPTAAATVTAKGAQQLRNNDERLEKALQREQKELAGEQKILAHANEAITKAQDRINDRKAKGLDTSQLEAALAGFQNAVNSAQNSYNSAKGTLDARAGFGAGGEVTDATQAKSTLDAARKAMVEFRQTIRQAAREFRTVGRDLGLSDRLARLQKELGGEQKRLDQANKTAINIQSLIDKQKANGKDTSKVEAALGSFKTAITSAQGSLDSARTTLEAKAGFDSNGKVTDPTQARDTMNAVAKAFRQLNQTLRQAGKDLQQAIKDFRAANKA